MGRSPPSTVTPAIAEKTAPRLGQHNGRRTVTVTSKPPVQQYYNETSLFMIHQKQRYPTH